MNISIAENITLAALPSFAVTPLRFVEQDAMLATAAASRGAVSDQGGLDRAAGQEPVGRQPAEGGASPNGCCRSRPSSSWTSRRAASTWRKVRNLFDHRPSSPADGGGVLFISSEIEELIAMCDRILVMSRGEIVGEFARRTFDKERILRSAFREQEVARMTGTRGAAADSACATRRRSSSSSCSSSSACRRQFLRRRERRQHRQAGVVHRRRSPSA